MTDATGADSGSVRSHLERAAQKDTPSGRAARAELAKVALPRAFRAVWRHYQALDAWRSGGGMGPAPLTLADVEAYERRFKVTFLPGVLDLFKALDAVSLSPSA